MPELLVPPELKEDPEVLRELAELDEILEANPLQGYNNVDLMPTKIHRKQLAFHAIKAPPLGIKALIAANRSGKTVGCIVDDIIQLIDERLVPSHLKAFKKFSGPVVIWIGAPKNETHFSNSIPLFRKFLPKEALVGGEFGKSFKRQPTPRLTLVNGSEVAFKTYDQDLDAWASAEVHRIHWDEEPNGENGRELRTEARFRLASTGGDEIIGMTPVLGADSWVNDEVWERRAIDPLVSVTKMRMEDNPWNTAEVIAKLTEGLTDDQKRARLNAEFVHLGGLFFPEFDEDIHLVDELTTEKLQGQEVVVSIDPGRQRTGVTWTAFDKDNAACVFDEFFPREATVFEVAAEIKERNKAWGLKGATYVIDPSSRNKSAINADDVEAAYAREEIYCQWGQNSRAAGILEMKRRLQSKTRDLPDPTLTFTRNCMGTVEQVCRYARDPKSPDEWKALPQSERTRFDLVDTVRYAVMSRTFYSPEEDPYKRPAFQPNFQMPYAQERELFVNETPPMGQFS